MIVYLLASRIRLLVIIITAPAHPSSTPAAFFHVMGSFSIRNDSTIANIGIDVVMMLELLGDVILRPMV